MDDKQEHRFKAVLALLRGEPVSQVISEFGICRSDLYKFRKRALKAMQEALSDYQRGPKTPHNLICKEEEEQIKSLCERYPTLSSYQVSEKIGLSTNPRTIQRVRKRLGLARLPKRPIPHTEAKRFSSEEEKKIANYIQKQNHLGVLRLSWDITNILKIPISASSVLRRRRKLTGYTKVKVNWQFYERNYPHSLWHGDILKLCYLPSREYLCQVTFMDDYSRAYVVCELIANPTSHFTVQCLIRAMKQWKVIPKAILVDNGSEFIGFLLKGLCHNLGIRLIHIRVGHPQTNGKIERAFRDDRRDFYGLKKEWLLEPLRRELSDYVYYRNYQRGHWALNGKPASSRLREQNWVALPSVLSRLEDYARYELDEKRVSEDGRIRVLGRPLFIGKRYKGQKVKCIEAYNGLEIQNPRSGCIIGTLANYYEYRRLRNGAHYDSVPKRLTLQRHQRPHTSPRIAVA